MNLVDIMNKYGVDKLNTMTKYPSIQTYHEIDRGCLNDKLTEDAGFGTETVYITEKVDGTNGRILIFNGDYIIGSREDFLYRKGDIFGNPSQGIVDVMKPYAEHLVSQIGNVNQLYVFYGEVYGSNINGAKQYTKHRNANVRFFDIVHFSAGFEDVITKPIDHISIWREHGGQSFLGITPMRDLLEHFGYKDNMVPAIGKCSSSEIPISRAETYEWLKQFEVTYATIDKEKFIGRAEGVVVRNSDRSFIRKIRFEDYEKTLRKLHTL